MDKLRKIPLYIIASAGELKGAYSVGFMHRLQKYLPHFDIHGLDGSSIGAFIMAFTATKQITEVSNFITSINSRKVIAKPHSCINWINLAYSTIFKKSFYKHTPMKKFIAKNWKRDVEMKNKEALIAKGEYYLDKYHAISVRWKDGRTIATHGEDKTINKQIVASGSILPVYPPALIDNEYYIDGGYTDVYGISVLKPVLSGYIKSGVKCPFHLLSLINMNTASNVDKSPPSDNVIEILGHCAEVVSLERLSRDLDTFQCMLKKAYQVNDDFKFKDPEHDGNIFATPNCSAWHPHPDAEHALGFFDADQKKIAYYWNQGHTDAKFFIEHMVKCYPDSMLSDVLSKE